MPDDGDGDLATHRPRRAPRRSAAAATTARGAATPAAVPVEKGAPLFPRRRPEREPLGNPSGPIGATGRRRAGSTRTATSKSSTCPGRRRPLRGGAGAGRRRPGVEPARVRGHRRRRPRPRRSAMARTARRTGASAGIAFGAGPPSGSIPTTPSEGPRRGRALLDGAAARRDPALVAVGECGLDYYYDHSPRSDQRAGLRRARSPWPTRYGPDAGDPRPRRLGRPLRRAGEPRACRTRTVLHCFTGGPTRRAGVSTSACSCRSAGSSRSRTPPTCARPPTLCPLDRLLVETDSPFLAPVPSPREGQRAGLRHRRGRCVADARGDFVEVRERPPRRRRPDFPAATRQRRADQVVQVIQVSCHGTHPLVALWAGGIG